MNPSVSGNVLLFIRTPQYNINFCLKQVPQAGIGLILQLDIQIVCSAAFIYMQKIVL